MLGIRYTILGILYLHGEVESFPQNSLDNYFLKIAKLVQFHAGNLCLETKQFYFYFFSNKFYFYLLI